MVGELEAMYVKMFDGHGIAWSTHVSWFADLLLSRVPGLLKGFSGNEFFYSAVQNIIQNAQDFFVSLLNIGGPIRQAMRLKCQSTDANFKFGKTQDKSNQVSVNRALYTSQFYLRRNRSLWKEFFKRITCINTGNDRERRRDMTNQKKHPFSSTVL